MKRLPDKSFFYPTAALVGLYAAAFFINHNIEKMSLLTIGLTLLTFSLVSVLALYLFRLIRLRYYPGRPKNDALTQALLFGMLVFYFRHPLTDLPLIYRYLAHPMDLVWQWGTELSYLVLVFAGGAVGYFVPTGKLRKISLVLAVLILLNGYSLVVKYQALAKASSVAYTDEQWDQIQFTDRRNIVFVLVDSLTSLDGLQLLGMDYESFAGQLSDREFVLYPDFYTAFQSTFWAMPTFFHMQTTLNGQPISSVSSKDQSRLMAGKAKAYDLLRANDYDIRLVHSSNYLLRSNCTANSCFPDPTRVPESLYGFLQLSDQVLLEGAFSVSFDPSKESEIRPRFDRRLQTELDRMAEQDGQFYYLHDTARPGHSGNSVNDKCDEAREIADYQLRFNKVQGFIHQTIEHVDRLDPEAIIIIASDHGPYILDACTRKPVQLERDHIIERQGAFLAIRWGATYDGRFDSEVRSSQNLFRYVFSYLAGNDVLLENAEADHAYTGPDNLQTIDDGRFILEEQ